MVRDRRSGIDRQFRKERAQVVEGDLVDRFDQIEHVDVLKFVVEHESGERRDVVEGLHVVADEAPLGGFEAGEVETV